MGSFFPSLYILELALSNTLLVCLARTLCKFDYKDLSLKNMCKISVCTSIYIGLRADANTGLNPLDSIPSTNGYQSQDRHDGG